MDPERLKMARAKLATDPYNLESWEVIARDAQSRRIEDARNVFEEIVDFFPTSGKFWKMYIEQEVIHLKVLGAIQIIRDTSLTPPPFVIFYLKTYWFEL